MPRRLTLHAVAAWLIVIRDVRRAQRRNTDFRPHVDDRYCDPIRYTLN